MTVTKNMCRYVLSVYASCKLRAYSYIPILSFLSSQNREAGPFVAARPGPGDHFRLQKVVPRTNFLDQFLVAKFGPARTSFGKRGPILALLLSDQGRGGGGAFLTGKIGPGGPLLGRTNFGVTVHFCFAAAQWFILQVGIIESTT